MKAPDQFIIVDDDASNNFLCQCAIRVLFPGTTVRLFTNPVVALQTIEKEYVNVPGKKSVVLFLDINMPELNGWSFLDRFEQFDPGIRGQFIIYMLTSSIDPNDKEKAIANREVAGFLSKPLIVKELRQLFAKGSEVDR